MSHCININTVKFNPTMEVSVKKVKTDRIDISAFYDRYAVEDTVTFKNTCVEAIMQSSGKKETKARFVMTLQQCRTKDKMLSVVSNYWLAGQGLKV